MLRRCVRLISCKEMLGYSCAAKIHTNFGRVLYSSNNNDLPNPKLQAPLDKVHIHDSNFLMDQIKEAKTLESILELFSTYQDVLNAQHIVALLKSLHNHSKEKGLNPETLKENQTFQALCSHLMKELRVLESQEVITVYRILSSFGIRNNSFIMQSILRKISKNLKSMNLEQVAFLCNLLSKQRHGALVDDLRLSLPLVLQVKIDRLLDSEDMSQVVDCLHLAYRSRLKPVTVQKIVSSILLKAKTLSPSNATTVISALVNIDTPVDGYRQLLDAAFEVVTENLNSLDQQQVLSILKICREKGLYRNSFLSGASKKVVSERWNLESTQKVLEVFDAMKFRSPQLRDYFSSGLCLEADVNARTVKAV